MIITVGIVHFESRKCNRAETSANSNSEILHDWKLHEVVSCSSVSQNDTMQSHNLEIASYCFEIRWRPKLRCSEEMYEVQLPAGSHDTNI